MDKNEYNLKLEEIEKYANQGNYSEAALLADTIEWRRVRNVRTLCMVSEIYEADHRYEDSKALLLRAYRRSPVGRTILYRLVEVTIQLKQFDEAIEYYSEYVQAAPNDNNKYILKYKIYKGRGSSIEEQIDILKEYLDKEYSEKWAYELAKLYQQAEKIPECLAACDDLVLWFHSGKYVTKALELKRKYAPLTPKQQEIYDHRFDEDEEEETKLGQEKQIVDTSEDSLAESIMADVQKEIAQSVTEERAKDGEIRELSLEDTPAKAEEEKSGEQEDSEAPERSQEEEKDLAESVNVPEERDLQSEMVKSMREIVAGVGNRGGEPEEDEIAADQVIEQSKEEQIAAAGRKSSGIVLQRPPKIEIGEQPAVEAARQLSIDDILLSMGERSSEMRNAAAKVAVGKTQASGVVSAVDEALINMGRKPQGEETSKEAFEETAEKMSEEKTEETLERTPEEDVRTYIADSAEERTMEEDIFLAKTRRISSDEIAEIKASRNIDFSLEESDVLEEMPAAGDKPEVTSEPEDVTPQPEMRGQSEEAAGQETQPSQKEAAPQSEMYSGRLRLKEYQRGMFEGFIGIQNMEEQIANAILQAGQKGGDRTSRTGNILIFGGHGCGKTTIATNIAKAIAQERGSQYLKMAKVYAADFNRKDIASTIAKIAGGMLIIEEAGDLEDAVVDQLTTAMEFRTDGLIIILEDEQKYIHELLMRHPRFTMKFTAQIYIPVFTIDELVRFGQIYAADKDYVFSDSAVAVLHDRIGSVAVQGDAVSITNVTELVDRAIIRSNKFFRKLAGGKKRYDENNCIILQDKDFR